MHWALEGGGAGGAKNEAAESVAGGVSAQAAGSGPSDPGARFAGGKGDRGCAGGYRGGLRADELAVDEALEPKEAGVVAAGLVDAGCPDIIRCYYFVSAEKIVQAGKDLSIKYLLTALVYTV